MLKLNRQRDHPDEYQRLRRSPDQGNAPWKPGASTSMIRWPARSGRRYPEHDAERHQTAGEQQRQKVAMPAMTRPPRLCLKQDGRAPGNGTSAHSPPKSILDVLHRLKP